MDDSNTSTSKHFTVYCCNPFKKPDHNYYRKNLRSVNENILKRNVNLNKCDKICDGCRKAVLKLPENLTEETLHSDSSDSQDDLNVPEIHVPVELSTPQKKEAIESLNRSLIAIEETPIKTKRLTEKKYPEAKIQKVTDAFRTKILDLNPCSSSFDSAECFDCEIIKQLKEKFNSTTDKSVRMQILTTLPKSWTLKKIETEFGVSNFTARKAKKLLSEKGVMSSPDPKPGRSLDPSTTALVTQFYESDDISRQMPGKKDFVSVIKDGKRVHFQKYLMLSTLRESYELFKERYPDKKIGISKFCELRPKHCVLPGSSGTHSVCVCTIHQNAKLIIAQCNIPELTNGEFPIKTYKDVLSNIICKEPTSKCYFSNCVNCPGSDNLKTRFEEAFQLNSIENVSFKQWMQIDNKCILETITKPTEEFLDYLFQSLPKLLRHSFIASQQSSYLRHLKENLPQNECIVIADFSENYAFLLQDSVQGFHWNNAQATIHPFVIYYIVEETKLTHLSLVIISDCMVHDAVAVHLFQRLMIDFLKQNLPHKFEKMNYFSDGAASQYKNKSNFLNLCHHENDFEVKAEWNFFASSHGKNACDGVGGTVKRLATLASLRMVYNDQIMTPRQLYVWAKDNIANINFLYSTTEAYEAEAKILEVRFQEAKLIKGTQQFHSFSPVNETRVLVKSYSFSEESSVEIVSINDTDDNLDIKDIVGFITCEYSDKWWLGCVLGIEGCEVKISFLEPHGPSPSFKYPQFSDILVVHKSAILTKVDPTTATGRVYQLTESETKKANKKLFMKLKRR